MRMSSIIHVKKEYSTNEADSCARGCRVRSSEGYKSGLQFWYCQLHQPTPDNFSIAATMEREQISTTTGQPNRRPLPHPKKLKTPPLGSVIQTGRGHRVFAVFDTCTSGWVEIWAGCSAKKQTRATLRTPEDAKVDL